MRQQRRGARNRRATRLYVFLLRLYPRAHREAFAEQILQAFRDHYRDAVETGGESGLRFWLGVIGASLRGADVRRRQAAPTATRPAPPPARPANILFVVIAFVLVSSRLTRSGREAALAAG